MLSTICASLLPIPALTYFFPGKEVYALARLLVQPTRAVTPTFPRTQPAPAVERPFLICLNVDHFFTGRDRSASCGSVLCGRGKEHDMFQPSISVRAIVRAVNRTRGRILVPPTRKDPVVRKFTVPFVPHFEWSGPFDSSPHHLRTFLACFLRAVSHDMSTHVKELTSVSIIRKLLHPCDSGFFCSVMEKASSFFTWQR